MQFGFPALQGLPSSFGFFPRVLCKLYSGNASDPGTGSWVLSGSSGVRHPLSPVIGWVFETQTNKQNKYSTLKNNSNQNERALENIRDSIFQSFAPLAEVHNY